MAAQPSSVDRSPLSAQVVVGNAFVQQYYHILQQSPELVYRFYQEGSKLGRPDAHGAMSSVTTTDVNLPSEQGQHDLDQTTSSQLEDEEVNEEEVYDPSDNGEVVEEEEPTGVVIDEVPSSCESSVATAQEEMPKKSYASIVKDMNSASVSPPTRAPPKPSSSKAEPQVLPAPPAGPASDMPTSSFTTVDSNYTQDTEGNNGFVSS
ncbi:hypothetical protein B296_00054873 [Ensete ventricosum]|uniref:NTF2 domain-containing protein n=1 Tax=Ensete ventricosum TaxID=4639 RepID=A0A426Y205_ENSVE|nr:hypothetical protein B296_00054873 [Ensete ventricosum]